VTPLVIPPLRQLVATSGKLVTYKEFAKPLGISHRNIGPWLDEGVLWCRQRGVPELPVLVVAANTGKRRLPSKDSRYGLWAGISDVWLELEQQRCWRYDWSKLDE
jgi:hypothetical protein